MRGTVEFRVAVLLAWFAFLTPLHADTAAGPELREKEQILRAAGVAWDGLGLLEFFRKQTKLAGDRPRLRALVAQLGDARFRVRKQASAALVAIGLPALPELRRAQSHPDIEVKVRAGLCIQAIEGGKGGDVAAAALQLLRHRRPPGTCSVVLAYLAWVDGEGLREEVLGTLLEVGVPEGKVRPSLAAALDDPHPECRGAAALLVGRFGTPTQQKQVRRLLTDADLRVRFRAVQGLVSTWDRQAVPALLPLLTETPPELAEEVEDFLQELAGPRIIGSPLGTTRASRRKCRESWETWWREEKDRPQAARAPQNLYFTPGLRSRRTARRFLRTWIAGQSSSLAQMTEMPFYWRGDFIADRGRLDKWLNVVPAAWKQQNLAPTLHLQIRGAARATPDTLGLDAEVFDHLSRPGEIHIVHVFSNVYRGSVLVRLGRGPARVVGLGIQGLPVSRKPAKKGP